MKLTNEQFVATLSAREKALFAIILTVAEGIEMTNEQVSFLLTIARRAVEHADEMAKLDSVDTFHN